MRIAFSIILNGMNHLNHDNYYQSMLNNFDLWVVSEGASQSKGSTSWCKKMGDTYHRSGRSIDGTHEFLKELESKNSNFKMVTKEGLWESKDCQVNAAIQKIRETTQEGYLWQVDIDEFWEKPALEKAEMEMDNANLNHGRFLAEYYVGKDIVAKGDWGEGLGGGYSRLWKWRGQLFETHEPPVLVGGNGNSSVLTPRFKHYSYYFESDVKFKNEWYSGHEGIYDRWKTINSLPPERFPIHISNLIVGPWGKSNTFLYKKKSV